MSSTEAADLKLFKKGGENDRFKQNVAYLKENYTELYERVINHTPTRYAAALNQDGGPNLIDLTAQKALLPISKFQTDEALDELLQSNVHARVSVHLEADEFNVEHSAHHPLIHQLAKNLLDTSPIGSAAESISKDAVLSGFIPLLRIYGIGTGLHISRALQKFDVGVLIIHEPEFDLFYSSLFFTPWDQIFIAFDFDPHRDIRVLLGDEPTVFDHEKELLQKYHSFFYKLHLKLFHSVTNQHVELMSAQERYDSIKYQSNTAGWYEDQRAGLLHAIQNAKLKGKFFNGGRVKQDLTVFVVGSGPSLNESIGFIRENKDKAIIMSCGSAVSSLKAAKIVPDIHVQQERFYPYAFATADDHDPENFKNIIYMTLSQVEPSVNHLYKEVLHFQKVNDPGSCILENSKFPQTTDCNPTVSNAGISFAASIGASSVFLFGCDYGAPQGEQFVHAQGTFVYKGSLQNEQKTEYKKADDAIDPSFTKTLPGNFSSIIKTSDVLAWSHEVTERLVRENPNTDFINVGDGAYIEGAKPLKSSELFSDLTLRKIDKSFVLDEIIECFDNNYTIEEIAAKFESTHFPDARDYLMAIAGSLDSIPPTRKAMLSNVALMERIAYVGLNEPSYMPQKLFGCEFFRFLELFYTHVALSKTDDEAYQYARSAAQIFKDHLDTLFQDFQTRVINTLN